MSAAIEVLNEAEEQRDFRTVHRVVLPVDGDTDVLPLYVDFNPIQRVVQLSKRARRRGGITTPPALPPAVPQHPGFVTGRNSLTLAAFRRVSLGTYFNAFPASYWRNHTTVETVRLTVDVDAEATVIVYRSSPRGTANRVESFHASQGGEVTFDLPLRAFVDGGWYWFDLVAHASPVTLKSAGWSVREPEGFVPGTLSIAVTTFNRPDYALRHIATLAGDADVVKILDRFILVDQGTDKVRAQPQFEEQAAALGDRLRIIEQGNIGGSGGFSRGMDETLKDGRSKYVMLLDDDVSIETEGILRAVSFADFTRTPTIVGGHMFNLYERSVLHTYGEQVDDFRYFWRPAVNTQEAHDFGVSNLRTTPWMHRRVDVDYNGWWMCMIPTSIVREIGYALPVFIKWDDAEYGIRAKEHGVTTVTLPGAAVWHMPWTEKDDTIDWQAYYHQRNRWVAALSHSPRKKGGRMPFESIAVDIRHLISMQYSAVEVRLKALEDVLSGPDHLHATIADRLNWVRQTRAGFSDAQVTPDLNSFPPVVGSAETVADHEPNYVAESLVRAAIGLLRQLRPVRRGSLENPEAAVPAAEARWWRLAGLDSALVSSSDGSSASWYKRDRARFVKMLGRTVRLHAKLMAGWDSNARRYKDALPRFTSQEAWRETFAVAAAKDHKSGETKV
ncbi:MAG: glycosyltransferase [Arthrobacter sp.]|nr:glycosyltransferase [Arthrobacter sp.]